ncbi:MAG: hypothetical protein D6786_08985, partial [Gammaproteobacteria bacterium]
QPVPAAHPQGTTVEVRDLFFNTPVRRRFLRSERTELHHLVETVRRVALGHAGLRVRMRQGARRLLEIPAAAQEERLDRVLGARFRQGAVRVEAATTGMRLGGWLGEAGQSRSQSDRQYLLLNGRWIRDQGLFHAVRLAYGDSLSEGRHPVWYLELELDPALVDVNVHPAKSEVRFREPRQVHDFVLGALLRARGASGHSSVLPLSRPARPVPHRGPEGVREPVDASCRPSAAEGREVPDPAALPLARIGTCLLARRGNVLLLIDVARAESEALKWRMRMQLEEGPLRSQPLLLPVQRQAGPEPCSVELLTGLERLGLGLRREGGALVLTHVPALLAGADPQRLLEALEPVSTPEQALEALAEAARGTRGLATDERLLSALEELDDAARSRCLRVLEEGDLLALLEQVDD